MNYNNHTNQDIATTRKGIAIQKKEGVSNERAVFLDMAMEEIGIEIKKRIQLVLDFDGEPSDGAFAD